RTAAVLTGSGNVLSSPAVGSSRHSINWVIHAPVGDAVLDAVSGLGRRTVGSHIARRNGPGSGIVGWQRHGGHHARWTSLPLTGNFTVRTTDEVLSRLQANVLAIESRDSDSTS